MSTLSLAMYAAQVANDVMTVPDYIAGFIYGMTGDNHLSEIEACYNGSTDFVSKAQSAVADIQAGHYVKGTSEIGQLINEWPTALATC